MRIQIIHTPRGRRFYLHGLGSDHQTWVLFFPREHAHEQFLIERSGKTIYTGELNDGSFGPISCFAIARPELLGKRHPKLYASLFQVGDVLRILPSATAGMPHHSFAIWFWYQMTGVSLLPKSPYLVKYSELESAA